MNARIWMERAALFILFVFVAIPGPSSPTIALVLGVLYGVTVRHPYPKQAKRLSTWLLQISIVAMGFDMNLQRVLAAGRSGFVYTLGGIAFALIVGRLLGRILSVAKIISHLISVGTAICGGSAIAAMGPVVGASDEEMSVSIGTIFILNAIGLLIFPPLGHAFGLSQEQFGLWAALAIHDTSSVVGAGTKYGETALMIATTVKLARALWIVPLTIGTAVLQHKGTSLKSIKWPWFIGLFLIAAIVRTYIPSAIWPQLAKGGKIGLTVTLFLIGTSMSRESIAKVGARPLVQGVLLWLIVATTTLALVHLGVIAV
ncbi:MAG TPA: putative sulfate exporter family transporter [Polyangiaceae bacterium]|nr:putative sulfate exporter family transporter [Polyangiaceae bacterium]